MYDSEFGVVKEIYFVKKKHYASLSSVEEDLKQKLEEMVTSGVAVKPPHPGYSGNGKSLFHMKTLLEFMKKYIEDPNYIVFEIRLFIV